MERRWIGVGAVVLAVGLLATGQRAQALITSLLPLSKVLAEHQFICTVRVEKVDPARPATIFLVEEDLKGKFPYRRLPVNLTGDTDAKKYDHTAKLLKRLAPKLPLVLFVSERKEARRLTVFGYTNGTWFQMVARGVQAGQPPVFGFTHCEPYLRRTFAGTTADMRQVVIDGLSGKKKPPPVNDKEPPGFGPEVKDEKTGRLPSSPRVAPRGFPDGPLFAVIPTLGIGGPLAILAVLFPSLFGGVLVLFRRWLAFFTLISINSLLYCLHLWFAGDFLESWWSTPAALWFAMTVVTLLCTAWAWWRHLQPVGAESALPEAPPRTERMVLWMLSLSCLGAVLFCLFFSPPTAFEPWWNLLLALSFGVWAGALYKLFHDLTAGRTPAPALGGVPQSATAGRVLAPAFAAPSENITTGLRPSAGPFANGAEAPTQSPAPKPSRPALPTEGVMLWVILFASIAFAALRPGPRAALATEVAPAGEGRAAVQFLRDKGWTKVFEGSGGIVSSPLVAGDRIYVAVASHQGFENFGALYCVDANTQEIAWKFTNDGDMKQVFSSPTLADGRIYIGEGFHQDSGCKLYCIDAKSGKKVWDFATGSHTESTPVVVNGRVYFGAGDDGVYCVDAVKGTKIWQFTGGERAQKLKVHVDATPAVAGKRVYIGGGIDEDDGHGDAVIACLDADTGKEIWLRETPRWMVRTSDRQGAKRPLPAWGSPVVDGKQVFFGVGNGRMTGSSKVFDPIGALLCVDADTGKDLWPPVKVDDGVLNRPALDRSRVYFGARDCYCYCVDRETGKILWKKSLGSAVVAAPALDWCGSCGHTSGVYAIGVDGQVCCLDPYTGAVQWSFADPQQRSAVLASSPTVVVTHLPRGDRRRIYFGASLNDNSIQALYCLEDFAPER